jgi:hypothetical protein
VRRPPPITRRCRLCDRRHAQRAEGAQPRPPSASSLSTAGHARPPAAASLAAAVPLRCTPSYPTCVRRQCCHRTAATAGIPSSGRRARWRTPPRACSTAGDEEGGGGGRPGDAPRSPTTRMPQLGGRGARGHRVAAVGGCKWLLRRAAAASPRQQCLPRRFALQTGPRGSFVTVPTVTLTGQLILPRLRPSRRPRQCDRTLVVVGVGEIAHES